MEEWIPDSSLAIKQKINETLFHLKNCYLYVYFFSFSLLSLNKSGTDLCMCQPSKSYLLITKAVQGK